MLIYVSFFLSINFFLESFPIIQDCSPQNIYFQPKNQLRFYKHPVMDFLQHNSDHQLSLKNFANYIYDGLVWYGSCENDFFL